MTALQHSARLHETTVQRIAKGEVNRYRISGKLVRNRNGAVVLTQVHPLVMDAAKALIDSGSYTRIEIIDERAVMVR